MTMRRILGSRGTSTVELLAVLPTLLVIMLASVELSRAWMTVNLMTTAAREGVRRGSVSPSVDAVNDARDRIVEVLAAGGVDCASCATVTCDPDPCDANTDSRVRADVSVTFRTIVPLFLPILSSVDLQQTASMRYEGNPAPPSP